VPDRFVRFVLLPCLVLSFAGCRPPSATDRDRGTSDAAAPASAGDSGARAEVLAALQSVFDALASGDSALLTRVMEPDVQLVSIEEDAEGATGVEHRTLQQMAARIADAEEPFIERMFEPVVHVAGPLATVWTPYDFYVGERFSHCGVDVATLVRREGGWRIVSLSWTRAQPPACDRHPDGPPGGAGG